MISVSIFSLLCTSEIIEDGHFSCGRCHSGRRYRKRNRNIPNLDPVKGGHFVSRDAKGDTHNPRESLIIDHRSPRGMLSLLMLRSVSGHEQT